MLSSAKLDWVETSTRVPRSSSRYRTIASEVTSVLPVPGGPWRANSGSVLLSALATSALPLRLVSRTVCTAFGFANCSTSTRLSSSSQRACSCLLSAIQAPKSSARVIQPRSGTDPVRRPAATTTVSLLASTQSPVNAACRAGAPRSSPRRVTGTAPSSPPAPAKKSPIGGRSPGVFAKAVAMAEPNRQRWSRSSSYRSTTWSWRPAPSAMYGYCRDSSSVRWNWSSQSNACP